MSDLARLDTPVNDDAAFDAIFPPLGEPSPAEADAEARDETAAMLRVIAERIRSKGWMNTAREQAAFTLEEVAQAIEWGL